MIRPTEGNPKAAIDDVSVVSCTPYTTMVIPMQDSPIDNGVHTAIVVLC